MRLLDPADPHPVIIQKPGAPARFLVICDHAGRAIPRKLGTLGLAEPDLDRHIAWDIGAGELSRMLGEALQAPVIRQAYSRLVIDCNRAPGRPDSIAERADGTLVLGNAGLSAAEVAARVEEIHAPYHGAIEAELDARAAAGEAPILLLVHSFTPVMDGEARPWSLGVLHDGRSPYSLKVLDLLRHEPGHVVGDNQPYAMDGIDYTAPRHAFSRGLDYLELEVRQDLIKDEAGRRRIADLLVRVLPQAL